MKILCLLSWQTSGKWLWNYLPDTQHQIDIVRIDTPVDRFPGYGKFLAYYPKFWLLGLRAFPQIHKYDLVVSWEANTGLPLAFLRSLTGKKAPPLVILNFVLKNRPILDMTGAVRFAMRTVDHITCISQQEIDYYTKILNYPANRCTKLQGPWHDRYSSGRFVQKYPGDYIFSAGRSHRDYRTLIEAVRELPVQLIINARAFNLKHIELPQNVIANPFLPFDQFLALLCGAKFVVVPLFAARHASGESFMAQAMSTGKAVIVSETFSTREMVSNGVTGLLVPAGDVKAMRDAIEYLLDHPETREAIGLAARRHYLENWSFPVVAKKIDLLLQNLIHK